MGEKKSWRLTAIIREADEEQASEILTAVRQLVQSSDVKPGGFIVRPFENGEVVEKESEGV